jgi:hypothetical protein
MRKRMVATGSPRSPERLRPLRSDWGHSGTSASGTAVKSIRVVMKRPCPVPVRLGSEIVLDDRAHQQPVADHQWTAVVLLAVGGDDRGEALVVEQGHHLLVGPAPLLGASRRCPGLLGQQREARRPRMIQACSMVGGAITPS